MTFSVTYKYLLSKQYFVFIHEEAQQPMFVLSKNLSFELQPPSNRRCTYDVRYLLEVVAFIRENTVIYVLFQGALQRKARNACFPFDTRTNPTTPAQQLIMIDRGAQFKTKLMDITNNGGTVMLKPVI